MSPLLIAGLLILNFLALGFICGTLHYLVLQMMEIRIALHCIELGAIRAGWNTKRPGE